LVANFSLAGVLDGIVEGTGNIVGEIGSCAAPTYDLYLATEYSCATLSPINYNVVVAFPAGTSVTTYGPYYPTEISDGLVYELQSPTTSGPGKILTTIGADYDLSFACSVV